MPSSRTPDVILDICLSNYPRPRPRRVSLFLKTMGASIASQVRDAALDGSLGGRL